MVRPLRLAEKIFTVPFKSLSFQYFCQHQNKGRDHRPQACITEVSLPL
jgi:hypothetical protein